MHNSLLENGSFSRATVVCEPRYNARAKLRQVLSQSTQQGNCSSPASAGEAVTALSQTHLSAPLWGWWRRWSTGTTSGSQRVTTHQGCSRTAGQHSGPFHSSHVPGRGCTAEQKHRHRTQTVSVPANQPACKLCQIQQTPPSHAEQSTALTGR